MGVLTEGWPRVRRPGRTWETFVPAPQFFCEPKNCSKNKVYLKNKIKKKGGEDEMEEGRDRGGEGGGEDAVLAPLSVPPPHAPLWLVKFEGSLGKNWGAKTLL